MTCYQGTYYERVFTLTNSDDTALDITGWEFRAHFREFADDEEELLELTSDGGGFEIVSAAAGRVLMRITPAQSEELPEGNLAFDVQRTDELSGPRWLFGGTLPVRQPVTRDD